jgi:hypothetical protein
MNMEKSVNHTVKKAYRYSRPQSAVGMSITNLPKSPWAEIIKLFPLRETLVSDIPAEDRNIEKFFDGACIDQ